MSNAGTDSSTVTRFYVGFLLVTLIIAGGLSYFASSSPDGLDTVTLHGCQVVEVETGEQLNGSCIAQNTGDHIVAGSPLADYSIGGAEGTTGVAGVAGVVVTVLVAGGLFWLLRRRGSRN
ncbi:PDGLE domain-containing protein [Pseudonocardia sp. TRM90224]|uniref:PDGLE domain-containing protein n=1 Tax=Pseudonocardia sp. TRM90224 TaxID=2812678 RepID=UPI001E31FD14|nr:PDGLE domain-containing protein [Pseudonocardia sp. TRM90224]